MANLETLELTINANAQSASQGLTGLINSLRSLTTAVGRGVSSLKHLNSELEALKRNSNVKLPGMSAINGGANATKGIKQTTKAVEQQVSAVKEWKQVSKGVSDGRAWISDEQFARNQMAREQERFDRYGISREEAQAAADARYQEAKAAEEAGNAGAESAEKAREAMMAYADAVRMTKEELLQMKVATAGDKVQSAINSGDPSKLVSSVAAYQKAQDNLKNYQAEQALGQKLMQDLQTAGASQGMQDFARAELDAGASASSLRNKLFNLDGELKKKPKDASKAADGIKNVGKSAAEASQMTEKHTGKIRGLLKNFGRIAKTMTIRLVIRSMMNSAKEGLAGYLDYAKRTKDGFADAMTTFSATGAELKGQIGAALGTAIAQLLPLLQQLATYAVAAANALTMLIAVLGGQSTYDKAVVNMDKIGKAAGGAGGGIKEMLAEFDELNVIASESGGGGGGGGIGDPFDYVPTEIPKWLVDLAPILKWIAAIAAVVALLIKLWNWIKKIKDAWDTIKKFFNPTGDSPVNGPNFNPPPDYKEFIKELAAALAFSIALKETLDSMPDHLEYKIVVDREEYDAFMQELEVNSMEPATKRVLIKVDDTEYQLKKSDVDLWCAFVAQKRIDIDVIDGAYNGIKDDINGWNPGNKFLTITVDRTAYDNTQSDIGGWNPPQKTLVIVVNRGEFDAIRGDIEGWNPPEKQLKINVDRGAFDSIRGEIDGWNPQPKNVVINADAGAYWSIYNNVEGWCGSPATKQVDIALNSLEFLATKVELAMWAVIPVVKNVTISVDSKDFTTIKLSLSGWIAKDATKKVTIEVDDSAFQSAKGQVNEWVSATGNKRINVVMENIEAVLGIMDAITEWANTPLTKTITVIIKEKNAKTNSSSVDNPLNTKDVVSEVTKTESTGIKIKQDISGGGTAFTNMLVDLFANTPTGFAIKKANGAFGIPMGEVFVAQEHGAELVGEINGKTSVANQQQIVDGIALGVASANSEQNSLLREQNSLLRGILEKDISVKFGASAALGRTVRQSLDMYGAVSGV